MYESIKHFLQDLAHIFSKERVIYYTTPELKKVNLELKL